MKHIIVAIGVFILGFILLSLASGFMGNGSSSDSLLVSIVIAILYLAAVVSCTVSILIEKIDEK